MIWVWVTLDVVGYVLAARLMDDAIIRAAGPSRRPRFRLLVAAFWPLVLIAAVGLATTRRLFGWPRPPL